MIHRMDPPADEAAGAPMPEKIVPMMARTGTLPRDDEDWAFEVKWDGVRAICHSEPGRMRLHSRNLLDITPRYPEVGRLNRALSHHRAVLDGEIVALDAEGKPSFGALQRRMHVGSESTVRRLAKETPVTYIIFDLLWLDGRSLMDLPYTERRARLAELELGDGGRWRVPDYVVGHGEQLLAATEEQGLEGVIAKRLDSKYEPGRRTPVVAEDQARRRARRSSSAAGCRATASAATASARCWSACATTTATLRHVGRVGTGFTESELDRLAEMLRPLEREDSPFAPGGPKIPRGAVFADPELVAEVEFREWTDGGQLRAPSYKGLRDDKPAELVVREEANAVVAEVGGRQVKLSNLDKVLYPEVGFAKRDVIDYHARIAPVVLPHLEGRALTLKRYPNGVDAQFFYEKNAPSHRPEWVSTARVGSIDYVVVDHEATLVWLANLADLELHTSLALADDPQRPTLVAFDLDPGPPATVVECCRVAELLRGMFEGLGLECFAKTSGSKGMQVYLPINREATFAQTKAFSKAVAELLAREEPGLVVARQTKSARAGKVLVDWGQNDVNKTTINVYSLRAMARPTVSTPVTWDEVRAAQAARGPHLRGGRRPAPRRGARRPLRPGADACPAPPRGVAFAPWPSCAGSSPRSASRPRSARPSAPSAAWSCSATPSARPPRAWASTRRPPSRPRGGAGSTRPRRPAPSSVVAHERDEAHLLEQLALEPGRRAARERQALQRLGHRRDQAPAERELVLELGEPLAGCRPPPR